MSAPTREQLVKLLAECPDGSVRWAGIGWQLGMLDGTEQGIAAERWAEECRWNRVYLSTRKVLDQPTQAELRRRREIVPMPCKTWCRRCSACIAADAWAARRGRPHLGVQGEATSR
jgi:hypothetical protein